MSRAGRAGGAAAKKRELHARLQAAVAEHEARTAEPEPVEIPPEVQAQLRAHQVFTACKQRIVGRYPSLWPGEVVGSTIAEQWLMNLAARMREQAEGDIRERAAAAGLILPS